MGDRLATSSRSPAASLPQAIKDEMLASAIRKYNMLTETDVQLVREALERMKGFRR
jgi:hypothetical protein